MEKPEYLDWLNQYTDAEACTSSQQSLPYYLRVNSLKTTAEEYLNWTNLKLEKTFLSYAFQVKELPPNGLGNTIDYATGWMHTQSLSSMLPPHLLNPKPGENVLDICAAPGSKTTQCAALMQNKGIILANDKNKGRISALANNIERLGVINTSTMNQDGARFTSPHKFQKILVDAPCSGLGSSEKAYGWWEEKYSRNISALQTAILRTAFSHLEPGGTLVYSTCTYPPDENERPVSRLLEKNPNAKLEAVEIPNSEPGIQEFGKEFKKARRVYPHKFNSEGFFLAKIRKP
ncbi:NOL1/NOP2/sun family putative RNA methylase [Candidatus Micrarchaeota archaeon]|nr:NOL1/NOP2/sun family putative RNA methylase [Candidatus Micrarchaeota archaeon]MBD3418208.1 NOL1/NOP2/sun family putative RNA methylase [Candidatus Micrarchaeota archaeon]